MPPSIVCIPVSTPFPTPFSDRNLHVSIIIIVVHWPPVKPSSRYFLWYQNTPGFLSSSSNTNISMFNYTHLHLTTVQAPGYPMADVNKSANSKNIIDKSFNLNVCFLLSNSLSKFLKAKVSKEKHFYTELMFLSFHFLPFFSFFLPIWSNLLQTINFKINSPTQFSSEYTTKKVVCFQ